MSSLHIGWQWATHLEWQPMCLHSLYEISITFTLSVVYHAFSSCISKNIPPPTYKTFGLHYIIRHKKSVAMFFQMTQYQKHFETTCLNSFSAPYNFRQHNGIIMPVTATLSWSLLSLVYNRMDINVNNSAVFVNANFSKMTYRTYACNSNSRWIWHENRVYRFVSMCWI